jgi:cytochrome c oxidase subunit 2
MKKQLLLGFLVVSVSLALLVCSGGAATPKAGKKAPLSGKAAVQVSKVRTIKVLAKQFEFIPKTIVLKKGVPVRLVFTSQDVTHGFAVDAFKINVTIEKGKDTVLDFTPDKTGTFDFYCSYFCGFGHHDMRGKLIVN